MSESVIGANFIVGFDPTIQAAIQDRTLVRVFRDALFPRLLYRAEAAREEWPVNLGANQTFTRSGTMAPTTRPIQQNADAQVGTWEAEQWEANAKQYGNSIDTHMPTSTVAISSLMFRNVHQLGLNGGQSLNRVVRDKVYNAYTAGNTVVSANTGGGTALPVVSINGFTRRLLNGRPTPVGPTNPLPIQIISGGVTTNFNVVGVTPAIAGDEIHGGTLTLDVAHGGVLARDAVLAVNRSRVVNVGGSPTIDGITSANQFNMGAIRAAVAQMRVNDVPAHEDGNYHCHLDPDSESQIYNDNEWQRLHQTLPDGAAYREFAIGQILGTIFIRNTEAPIPATVDQDPVRGFTFAPELTNVPAVGAPVVIHRPLFTGDGYLEEKFLDESKYISAAGVNGRIADFAVVNGGIQVILEGIRLIMRAPQDRLQQQMSATWSWSGDWPIPTDANNTKSPADFKRACVVQHGA